MSKKLYTEKDLVSFGNFLLSEKREESVKEAAKQNPESLPAKESKRNVYDADLVNWKK